MRLPKEIGNKTVSHLTKPCALLDGLFRAYGF